MSPANYPMSPATRDSRPATILPHTPAVEDYLKVIWSLQQTAAPVATSRIANRLDVSAASVTSMVKRLADQELLLHERYRGATLTAEGEAAALRVIRRHRVIESFLADVLGYPWDRVHDEAERLEHAASDELIDRLAALLGRPARDPHGSAIPNAAGELDRAAHPALAELAPNEIAQVVEVQADEPEQLRYLGTLGLYPGARVEVVERAPFDGPLVLRVDGERQYLSHPLAACIRVTRAATA